MMDHLIYKVTLQYLLLASSLPSSLPLLSRLFPPFVQYVNAPLSYEKSRRMWANDNGAKHVDQSNLPMVSILVEYITCVVH